MNWDEMYQKGELFRDRGGPSPPMKQYLERHAVRGRVLVPGCGRGHEVAMAVEHRLDATGVDIAPTGVVEARALYPHLAERFVTGSLLDPPEEMRGAYLPPMRCIEPGYLALVASVPPCGPGRWFVRRFKHTVRFACSALVVLLAVVIPVVAEPDKLPMDAAAALHAPANVVLYSLEPDERPTAKDRTLYGWKILGQVKLDKKQAKIAIAAVESAISQGDCFAGAHCFAPRHAIRVTVKDQTYDFVICYACGHISVSRGDTTLARLGAVGSPGPLNALLTAAKVPLAKTYDR